MSKKQKIWGKKLYDMVLKGVPVKERIGAGECVDDPEGRAGIDDGSEIG